MAAPVISTTVFLLISAFLVNAKVPPTFSENVDLIRRYVQAAREEITPAWTSFMRSVGDEGRPADIWDALYVSPRLYNVSEACYNDTTLVLDAVTQRQPWALRVLDATGKLESGLLEGNTHWWGSFSECRDIIQPLPIYNTTLVSAGGQTVFRAVPCTAIIGNVTALQQAPQLGLFGMTSNFELGVCVPSSCSNEDVHHLVNNLLFLFPEDYQAASVVCRPDEPRTYDTPAIAMICVLSVLGVVILAASLYDLYLSRGGYTLMTSPLSRKYGLLSNQEDETRPLMDGGGDYMPLDNSPRDNSHRQADGQLVKVLLSFSVCTNAPKLLSTTRSAASLDALHGIRFISMTWVILGHTYFFATPYVTNGLDLASYIQTWHFQAIINALVSVDTFFLLSGLLLSYLLLKEMDTQGGPLKINWIKFYFHRFWRLTPPYMLLLGVETALFKYWGTGPVYPTETGMDATCYKDWWANLLYINNILHEHMACFGWSWFLANDMQFFVLSPLFIIPLYLHWVAGLVFTLVVLLANIIVVAILSVQNDYGAELVSIFVGNAGTNSVGYIQDIYMAPWSRIGAYLIGIIYGFIIFKTKRQLNVHWILVFLGWLMAAVCGLAVVYGLYGEANGHLLSVSVRALYSCSHRIVWAMAVGWVALACVTGHGGWVNKFLSWQAFLPLSRLTYMAYLVHPIILMFFYASLERAIFLDTPTVVCYFLGYLVLSYGVAFVTSLCIESPMMGLEKVLLRR